MILRHLRQLYTFIILVLLNASCLSDNIIDGLPVPSKSSPFTCSNNNYFTKMGSGSLENSFFIGDTEASFYSVAQNRVTKYDLNTLQIKRERSFLPLQVSNSYFTARDHQTGWLLLQNATNGTWTANVLDTTVTILSSTAINLVTNDNQGHVIASAPDKGFVVVSNPSNLNVDKYTVTRYSELGELMWQKQLTNFGKIRSVLALSDGGYLIGGSTYVGSLPTRNSFLAKLDKGGNEVWKKSKDIGDLNSEYSINDLYEDASGDYFLLLHNQRSSLAVIRSDSAYNIQWSRKIYNNTQIYSMKMKRVQNEILTYFTGGTGTVGSFDIGFISVSEIGNINWGRTFGGTGDEAVYVLRYVQSVGYYLVGRTDNYDGANSIPISNSYLIKTDLEGMSCK